MSEEETIEDFDKWRNDPKNIKKFEEEFLPITMKHMKMRLKEEGFSSIWEWLNKSNTKGE